MRYISQKQPVLKSVYVCDFLHACKHTALGSYHRGKVGVGRVLVELRYAQLYEAGARGVVERRPPGAPVVCCLCRVLHVIITAYGLHLLRAGVIMKRYQAMRKVRHAHR